jgi:hypothetical protein
MSVITQIQKLQETKEKLKNKLVANGVQVQNEKLDGLVDLIDNMKIGDEYEGEYTIIPQVVSQTLETKEKLLDENITVVEIPYSTTANQSGGFTITIGEAPTTKNGEIIKFFKLEEN